jgi:hypothetical protein
MTCLTAHHLQLSRYISIYNRTNFNIENVNLLGNKWNETVSNIICYVSNRICNVSNEKCNTCATSYVAADNSRLVAYLILKVVCKWKNKDWSVQKWCLFYSKNKTTLFKEVPKHVIIFLTLQTFNRLQRLNRNRWIGHIGAKYVDKCELLKNVIGFGLSLTVNELWPFVCNKYG